MNKTELLADLAANVLAVGDSKLIETDAIANMRTYNYIAYVLQEDGTVKTSTQPIVIHNEGEELEAAYYNGRIVKNHDGEPPKVSGLEVVLAYLEERKAQELFEDYAFTDIIDGPSGKKIGIFSLTNSDYSVEKVAITTIDGVAIEKPYKA